MNSDLTVVLLPGLDGTGRLLQRFVNVAPRQCRPHVISYPSDVELDYSQLQHLVREQIPSSAPHIVVGESFSGPLAVALAAKPAAALRGIVMVASFVTPPALPAWRYLPWGLVFRLPAPAMILRRVLMPTDAELLRQMRETLREVSPKVLASRVRSTLAVDVRGDLADSTTPVLYVQAKRDRVVPARCLRTIMSLRQDVTVEVVDSAHPVLQLEPDAAWKVIERFIRRVHANY